MTKVKRIFVECWCKINHRKQYFHGWGSHKWKYDILWSRANSILILNKRCNHLSVFFFTKTAKNVITWEIITPWHCKSMYINCVYSSMQWYKRCQRHGDTGKTIIFFTVKYKFVLPSTRSIQVKHIYGWPTCGRECYATCENIAFYNSSWNKFLSYTNHQQISSTAYLWGVSAARGAQTRHWAAPATPPSAQTPAHSGRL